MAELNGYSVWSKGSFDGIMVKSFAIMFGSTFGRLCKVYCFRFLFFAIEKSKRPTTETGECYG